MKESSDGETLMAVGIFLGSSRGESTTSKIGFCPGNMQERLTRGTKRTTRLMVEDMRYGDLLCTFCPNSVQTLLLAPFLCAF